MSFVSLSNFVFLLSISLFSVQSVGALSIDRCERAVFPSVDGPSVHMTVSMNEPSEKEAAQIYSESLQFASIDDYRKPCGQNSRACRGSNGQTSFNVFRSIDNLGRLLSVQTRSQTVLEKFEVTSEIGGELYETVSCSTAPGLVLRCSKSCSISTDSSWGT